MKGKYFTFLLITLLIVSTPAFAQILIIKKDVSSIEVDSVRYENNQCIYTKNGTERSLSLDLIEEIYVLNEGRIYPPQPRKTQQPESAQIQETEIISNKKETYERNNRKKKSEGNTTVKDTVEPVEQTFLYKPPQGFFQCEIPKSWNSMEMFGIHGFSPYSPRDKDYSNTLVQIGRTSFKVDVSTISKEHKTKMLEGMERMGEKLLEERVRVICGIEAWETLLEIQGNKPRMRHQFWLPHDGYLVNINLEASPELYESANIQFERIVESLKLF
jgi:hypothetical protein